MAASHVTTILVTRAVIGCRMRAHKGGGEASGYENTRESTSKTFRALMLESIHLSISDTPGLLIPLSTNKKSNNNNITLHL